MKALLDFYAKLKKGERRILFVTAFFLAALFVDRVIILPLSLSLNGLSNSIKEQEVAIKKSMSVLAHKETITAESREFAQYSLEAKNPEEEMVALLKEVESVAERSGVNLIYVKPGAVKDEKGIKKYYSNLEFDSPMEQAATFFHGVESSNKLLKIEKYQIVPKSKDSSIARCTVSVYKTVLAK